MEDLLNFLFEEIEQSELDDIRRSELFEKVKSNRGYLAKLGATCAYGWIRIQILKAEYGNGIFEISFSYENKVEPCFVCTVSALFDNLEDVEFDNAFESFSRMTKSFLEKKKDNVFVLGVERLPNSEDEENVLKKLFRDFK